MSMTDRFLVAITLSLTLGLGCVGEEPAAEDPGGDHDIERSTHAVVDRTGEWSQDGNGVKYLMPRDIGFCYLVRVSGAFRGAGERVQLGTRALPNSTTMFWTLEVATLQSGTSARARCVRWTQLNTTPAAPPSFAQTSSAGRPADVGSISYVSYLSGLSGEFNGGGEVASLHRNYADWQLIASSLSGSGVQAWGVKNASARPINVGVTQPWTQMPGYYPLMSSDLGFCALDSISGELMGGGEYVEIVLSESYWWIGGASQQEGVGGVAQCFYYN